jgi:hypothetical protein
VKLITFQREYVFIFKTCLRSAVSGTVPEEPVVNRSNGQLYEKRLIEKHVQVLTPQAMIMN